MGDWLSIEPQEFKKILESEIEIQRGLRRPGGFLLPNQLDEALSFTERARTISRVYEVTVEQACFALAAAMLKMGWL